MIKKILITFTLILITSCEYKPIYSIDNKTNYKIFVTELAGDKKLNKFLVENIIRNSQKNSDKIVNIKINSKYSKVILAKDTAGNITDFQAQAIVSFTIIKGEISQTFKINEKFNVQKMSDKYEEKNYEDNIKRNLAISMAQKLILRLSTLK